MSSEPTEEAVDVEGTRTLPLDGLDDEYRTDCGDIIGPIFICLAAAKLLEGKVRLLGRRSRESMEGLRRSFFAL